MSWLHIYASPLPDQWRSECKRDAQSGGQDSSELQEFLFDSNRMNTPSANPNYQKSLSHISLHASWNIRGVILRCRPPTLGLPPAPSPLPPATCHLPPCIPVPRLPAAAPRLSGAGAGGAAGIYVTKLRPAAGGSSSAGGAGLMENST